MKKVIFLVLMNFGYGPFSYCQNLPPIIQKLADYKGSVLTYELNNTNFLKFNDLPKNFQESGQTFIKTKDHLLLLPKGTGRIYKLEKKLNSFSWNRLDSTLYLGYNFACIAFESDNNIYSFGGDGFWSTNGILRIFNSESKEWNAKSLSESIHASFPVGGDNFWFIDTANRKLYVKTHIYTQDLTIKNNVDSSYGNTVCELDLKTGNWEKIGKSFVQTGVWGLTPWGPMINNYQVVDIKNNRILEFNEKTKSRILGIFANSTSDNIRNLGYFIDSVYYFGNYNGFIDSISFSRSELIDTGKPFYQTTPNTSPFLPIKSEYTIIFILSVFSSFLLWINYKNKRNIVNSINKSNPISEDQQTIKSENINTNFRSSKIIDLLEEREKALLKLIYHQSSEERLTTIEEINHVIGVASRTPEIQKRLRSDLITSINSKLSILHHEKKPVIDKQRSEFDKRSFEYFIQPVHMELVEKVIG